MRAVLIVAILLIGATFCHPSNPIRAKRDTASTTDETPVPVDDFSGEASGETSGETSGEASGESSGETSGETSGEGSGESSGETSGEGSGDESTTSSPLVPVTELTIAQLETLNKYAQQVQAESQKLIHQANFVITEMTALSMNAQQLGALSNIVSANSQIVLDSARLSLNETETDDVTTTTTAAAPSACVASSVCYNDAGCGSNGKCIGALAGTCNCNSCVVGWPCQEDSACGGFVGACNSWTATCDCWNTYSQHNMTLTDAFTSFCNVAKCNGAEDNVENCFGLPCNYGFCVC